MEPQSVVRNAVGALGDILKAGMFGIFDISLLSEQRKFLFRFAETIKFLQSIVFHLRGVYKHFRPQDVSSKREFVGEFLEPSINFFPASCITVVRDINHGVTPEF